jgi:hypothetical protein
MSIYLTKASDTYNARSFDLIYKQYIPLQNSSCNMHTRCVIVIAIQFIVMIASSEPTGAERAQVLLTRLWDAARARAADLRVSEGENEPSA